MAPICAINSLSPPIGHLRTIAMPRNHSKYIDIFKDIPITSFLNELQKTTTP